MKYIQRKPYLLLLGLIVILLSFGFYKGDETLDVNIHDTYIVISWKHLMILTALLLFFGNAIYALIKGRS